MQIKGRQTLLEKMFSLSRKKTALDFSPDTEQFIPRESLEGLSLQLQMREGSDAM